MKSNSKDIEKIGEFSDTVIAVLNSLDLFIPPGTAVYIGETNRRHMERQHARDYLKCHKHISRIIAEPDFVGINESDGSIELIKTVRKNVKMAVRIAGDGRYYARSLYEVGDSRVKNSLKSGRLKRLT